jgi:DNA-directed RNA polymerase specialized sigma24 family protein
VNNRGNSEGRSYGTAAIGRTDSGNAGLNCSGAWRFQRERNMSADEAVAWVDRYRRLVEREVRKFMVNSPYDLEDYLNDAYEAALMAATVSDRKGISFSTAFWLILKRNTSRVSPCGSAKSGSSVSMSVFDCMEFSDEVYYGDDMHSPDPEERLLSGSDPFETEEAILLRLLERLMPVEKKVLSCVCGFHGKRMSYAETALFLGMSHGAVSQSFRRIMKKALQFRADCVRVGCAPCRSDR